MTISNEEKQRVWDAYRNRKPIRVPVTFGVNARVVLLDSRFNPCGISFEEYYKDAGATVDIQLKFMDYQAEHLNRYCDNPTGRPKEFTFSIDNQNIYDAAYFGCPVHFRDGQVPDVSPILRGREKNRIFDFDIEHPFENPFIKECFARQEALTAEAAKARLPGLALKVAPVMLGWDGPLTIAVQLRGEEILTDLIEAPDYATRLMRFLQKGAEIRNRALAEKAGQKVFQPPGGWLADDSIQLISPPMYRQLILPVHRQWYSLFGPGPHSIHLCGDATRHFATLHRELNVCSFDTGFPVNHGALRRALGPDVEVLGGPEVAILLSGTRDQVYRRTQEILQSGIMEGGRFILREGNNLPPKCPEENLAAMYQACLDHGNYR
jgi:uroporphyrinogen-III decarboxylase